MLFIELKNIEKWMILDMNNEWAEKTSLKNVWLSYRGMDGYSWLFVYSGETDRWTWFGYRRVYKLRKFVVDIVLLKRWSRKC